MLSVLPYVIFSTVRFLLTSFLFYILFSAEDGKLATGEIPLHDGSHLKWIHRILMGAYLLITNVLLINLLIAIFRYRAVPFKLLVIFTLTQNIA